jgi:hypothetical protein
MHIFEIYFEDPPSDSSLSLDFLETLRRFFPAAPPFSFAPLND